MLIDLTMSIVHLLDSVPLLYLYYVPLPNSAPLPDSVPLYLLSTLCHYFTLCLYLTQCLYPVSVPLLYLIPCASTYFVPLPDTVSLTRLCASTVPYTLCHYLTLVPECVPCLEITWKVPKHERRVKNLLDNETNKTLHTRHTRLGNSAPYHFPLVNYNVYSLNYLEKLF